MILHGLNMSCLFSPLHECCHGTAFRTRWLNEAVLHFCGLACIHPGLYFRYTHAAHHTHTQIRGKDSELILPGPRTLGDYLIYCSAFPYWKRNLTWLFRHAAGLIEPEAGTVIPESERPRIIFEARAMLTVYGLVAVVALATGSWGPIIYFVLPKLAGEPLQRVIRVAEHVGCAEGPDPRRNTRTTITNPLMQALCWNMPFHSEHHMFPSVPFHTLPALHQEIGSNFLVAGGGYIRVHVDILRNHLVSRAELRTGIHLRAEPAAVETLPGD